uniref:ANK_REP_REGION domain-containing protein n=1 Tax=Macrostomum lignano TaxID=282301 RepID=A0A1I8IRC2_9PLAT
SPTLTIAAAKTYRWPKKLNKLKKKVDHPQWPAASAELAADIRSSARTAMGTALSSPRDGPPNGINGGSGWGQQLRTSKSTFSLKTDRASLAGGSHLLQPQQQQLQLPAAPCKSQQSRSGLTKSTSCYAIKASAAGAAAASASAGTAARPAPPPRPLPATTPEGDKENTGRSGASDSRRLLVQASTSDLLKCVAAFLRQHCSELHCDSGSVVSWIRSVDRNLILQGWADMAFVNPPNLVFFYLLPSLGAAAATLLTWYVAYSYMGNEISYPLKPFLVDGNPQGGLVDRCISLANLRSADMLRLNSDPAFFHRRLAMITVIQAMMTVIQAMITVIQMTVIQAMMTVIQAMITVIQAMMTVIQAMITVIQAMMTLRAGELSPGRGLLLPDDVGDAQQGGVLGLRDLQVLHVLLGLGRVVRHELGQAAQLDGVGQPLWLLLVQIADNCNAFRNTYRQIHGATFQQEAAVVGGSFLRYRAFRSSSP